MSVRYCKACAGDVEEVDGYCLLGHPLKLSPPIPSVAEMRDEVSRALGEARIERGEGDAEAASEAAGGDEGDALSARWAAPDVVWAPPPPVEDPRHTVWGPLADAHSIDGDPITAFAPSSRMDWGPERPGLRARNPLRRKTGPAPA